MKRINTIFVATILVSLIFIVSISSIISTNISREAIELESMKRLEAIATSSAYEIESKLNQYELQIKTASKVIVNYYQSLGTSDLEKAETVLDEFDYLLKELNETNIEAIATYIEFNYDEFPFSDNGNYNLARLYVKDDLGVAQLSTIYASVSDLQSDEPYMAWYFSPINLRKGIWSNVYEDEFINAKIITYSMPIIVNDRVIAIIGVDLKFSSFENIIENIKVYDTGYAFLFNENFFYLVHPELSYTDNLLTIQDGQYAYMKKEFENSSSGTIKYFYNNQDKIMGFSHINNGWVVAVAPPSDEVFYFYNELKRKQITFFVIGIILSVLIASSVGYSISKPITEMAKIIKLSTSNSSIPDIEHKFFITEIRLLYRNFRMMKEQLNNAFNEIKLQNSNLESIVEARTHDLRLTNDQLIASINQLEATQVLLVKAEKEKEINAIVKNIAHTLNTPLGNSITTLSYLNTIVNKEFQDHKYYSNLDDSITLIEKAFTTMKKTIDGLNILTTDYKKVVPTKANLKTIVDSRIAWFIAHHPECHSRIQVKVDETYEIQSNLSMITKLFDTLLNLSYSKSEEMNELCQVDIHIGEIQDTYTINYEDSHSQFMDMEAFFKSISMNNSSMINFDLDLHLLNAIIQEGLQGSISLEASEKLIILIKIPKKIT